MTASTAVGNVGIGSWIERPARAAPGGVALIAGDWSVTYAELAGRVRRLANGLRTLCVAKGDREAWLGPNHPAFLESLLAAGLLGAALAPVNHRLDEADINWILDDTTPRVLIEHDAAGATAVRGPGFRHVAVGGSLAGVTDFEALIAASAGHAIQETVGLGDLCLLPHTSGTTGRPKGVMLTHGNITWNVVNLLASADFHSDDVTIALAPFFRVGGTGVNVLPVLFMGGTVVVPGDAHPDDLLRLTEQHHATVLRQPGHLAVPDPLPALADRRSIRRSLSDHRRCTGPRTTDPHIPGAGPDSAAGLWVDRSRAGRVAAAARNCAQQGWLGWDATAVCRHQNRRAGRRRCAARPGGGTSGPWPECHGRVLEPAGGDRRSAAPDGWLRTGDAARADEDGFILIVGRVADSFISHGQVVHPGDVERVLLSHPAVADAGVAPVPASGQEPVVTAFIVVAPGAETNGHELLAWCREQLAAYQVPDHVAFADRLPRNSVGKLIRAELRDAATPYRPAVAERPRAGQTFGRAPEFRPPGGGGHECISWRCHRCG